MNESKSTFANALDKLTTRDVCFMIAGAILAYMVW
jgi:hypothetical protein